MIPLPEWAPNVHPLIIHFPIALLSTAILVDLISLFTRRWQAVRIAGVILFVLGAFGALASLLTGRDAADSLNLPPEVIPAVTDHADMAELTLWFFGIYALIRLIVLWFDLKGKAWAQMWVHILLFVVGAAGYYLVVQTGDLGARLVYAYGLGVQPVEEFRAQRDEQKPPEQDIPPGDIARIRFEENGSWQWLPNAGAQQVLAEDFSFVQGRTSDLTVETTPEDSVLAIQLQSSPVLFTAGDPIGSLQAEALLNVSGFDGTLRLVHHVQDAQNYDFLEVANGQLLQGRLQAGTLTIFAEQALDASRWVALRAISDGKHFRGYVGDEMLTHGHGDAPQSGTVGLYFDGTGTVLLQRLSAQPLR